MSSYVFTNIKKALKYATEEEIGVSFVGLAKKWETEEDGKNCEKNNNKNKRV
jgi:hypothetical protein